MKLTSRDLELLQQALLELHVPRDLDALREFAPLLFKRVIPADYFLRLEFARGSSGQPDSIAALWEHPERAGRETVRRAMSHAPEHPFTDHVMRTGDLGPLRLSDFWTRRRQLASRVHQEVYAPVGIGRLLTMTIVRGGRPGAVNLSRPFEAPDFSGRDRELLRLLTPHFVQAVDAAERLSARGGAGSLALAGLGLTPRQRDVAGWLARGRTNAEIAALLAAGPRTVEKHVERILFKLGVENRTAATQVILGLDDGPAHAASRNGSPARAALRRALRPAAKRGRR